MLALRLPPRNICARSTSVLVSRPSRTCTTVTVSAPPAAMPPAAATKSETRLLIVSIG
jgi:hypothetical protein